MNQDQVGRILGPTMYLRTIIALLFSLLLTTNSQASGHEHHAGMHDGGSEATASEQVSEGSLHIAVCLSEAAASDAAPSHDDCLGCCSNHGGATEGLSVPRVVAGKGHVIKLFDVVRPASRENAPYGQAGKIPAVLSPESGNVLRL